MDSPGIPAFFAGRHVLVTGATGFMGKVLVEKLLRCCPDIECIYAVVRSKKGQTATERVNALRTLPVFELLLKENPLAYSKLRALDGETSLVDMGLSEEDQLLVQDKVSVVFHLAAALNWRASLKMSIKENVVGTKNVLDFCSKIRNLVAIEYTSTAFSQCGEEVLEERTYEPPFNPQLLMDMAEKFDEGIVESASKELYGPHPNCYTYTKAVAEGLAAQYADRLPIVIVRPSIVTPTLREPIPGWVDTLNGPVGVLAAAGKGVLRSMMCRSDTYAEVIPVDICINSIIAVAYMRAKLARIVSEIPVYNVCSGSVERTTWDEVLVMGRKCIDKYPFEWCLWYPDGSIRTNWYAHMVIVFLFQTIPAYVIDFLLLLCRQERFMVRVQNKIKSGHDLLAFFTMREWKFDNHKGHHTVWPSLNPQDQETFFINNVLPCDKLDYLEKAMLGTRTYCLKEPVGSLKYCRARLRVQHVVHRVTVALFYMCLAYLGLLFIVPYFVSPSTLPRTTLA